MPASRFTVGRNSRFHLALGANRCVIEWRPMISNRQPKYFVIHRQEQAKALVDRDSVATAAERLLSAERDKRPVKIFRTRDDKNRRAVSPDRAIGVQSNHS